MLNFIRRLFGLGKKKPAPTEKTRSTILRLQHNAARVAVNQELKSRRFLPIPANGCRRCAGRASYFHAPDREKALPPTDNAIPRQFALRIYLLAARAGLAMSILTFSLAWIITVRVRSTT